MATYSGAFTRFLKGRTYFFLVAGFLVSAFLAGFLSGIFFPSNRKSQVHNSKSPTQYKWLAIIILLEKFPDNTELF